MSVADVQRFWERMRGFGGSELFHEFRHIVWQSPPGDVSHQVIALANRSGLDFLPDDYRAAGLKGIDTLPETAQDSAAAYRRLVADVGLTSFLH